MTTYRIESRFRPRVGELLTVASMSLVAGTSVAWFSMRPPAVWQWALGGLGAVLTASALALQWHRRRGAFQVTLEGDHLTIDSFSGKRSLHLGELVSLTRAPSGLRLSTAALTVELNSQLEGYEELSAAVLTHWARPVLPVKPHQGTRVILGAWVVAAYFPPAWVPFACAPLLLFSLGYGLILAMGRGMALSERIEAGAWLAGYAWVPLCRLLAFWGV